MILSDVKEFLLGKGYKIPFLADILCINTNYLRQVLRGDQKPSKGLENNILSIVENLDYTENAQHIADLWDSHELMIKRNIRASEVAAVAGYNAEYLRQVFRGARKPSVAIAKAVDVAVRKILSDPEAPSARRSAEARSLEAEHEMFLESQKPGISPAPAVP